MSNLYRLEDWRAVAQRRTKEISLLPFGSSFIVRVNGWSLSGVSIINDDRLSCERANTVARGRLAIVDTPYGRLMRFVYAEQDYVRLVAADADSPTLCLSRDEIEIVGRPVKLVRRFPEAPRESEARP